MIPGDVVRHRVWGEGRVEQVFQDRLRVYFALPSLSLMVSFEEVGAIPAAAAAAAGRVARGTSIAAPTSDVSARVAVECLRQGQPPPMQLSEWTQGQAEAREQVTLLIENAASGHGGLAFVFGAYGGGKTHIGRLALELAASRKMATMWVEVDKNGATSLSRLGSVLARAFASLQLPDGNAGVHRGARGLGPLLRGVSELPNPRLGAAEILRGLLARQARWIQEEEAVEVLEQYLAGGPKNAATAGLAPFGYPTLPTLGMNSGTADERRQNTAQQLIRICDLVRAVGGTSICLVIDELDHDFAQRNDPALWSIRELMSCATEAGMAILLLSRSEVVHSSAAVRIELQELEPVDFAAIVRKTVAAYRAAYPEWSVDAMSIRALTRHLQTLYVSSFKEEGWGPRFFVRATIEACELARVNELPLGEAVGRLRVAT
jgi:hypothetical protein